MNEKTNYGNWVPEKALYLLFGLAAVFLTITVLLRGIGTNTCTYHNHGRGVCTDCYHGGLYAGLS